jgi:DNA replication and repair protein RecF
MTRASAFPSQRPDPERARAAFSVAALTLSDFRSYARLRLEVPAGAGLIVLVGPNGAGKTNVLEAISFLAPGRGLRAAAPAEPTRWGAAAAGPALRPAWAVAAGVEGPRGPREIGTGLDPEAEAPERRLVRVDGTPARAQGRLQDTFAVHWLTPPMERLFQDGAGERRKFVDRVAAGLDAGHAELKQHYERTARERIRLLVDSGGTAEPGWLASLEARMAESGIALACARQAAAARLDRACREPRGVFPGTRVAMAGAVEDWLAAAPALAAEERLARALRDSRERDALTGTTRFGPHRSDMAVRHAGLERAAEQCSTGEQKALLIALVLGAADVLTDARGARPALLLDEVAAHLDRVRREALFAALLDSGVQAWLAGTEREPFAPLAGRALFLAVGAGAIEPLP